MLASCEKPTPETPGEEDDANYTHVESTDPAMANAIATAKKSAEQFLQALRNPKPNYREFFVKKPCLIEGKRYEHMWIGNLKVAGDHLEGTIANDAYETKEVKFGQVVKFKLSEISDWKYLDGNRLVGGYTIRYFYDRMSKEKKKAFEEEAGFVIE